MKTKHLATMAVVALVVVVAYDHLYKSRQGS